MLIKAVQNGLDSQSLFHVLERVPRAHRGGVDRLERFHGDVAHGLGVVGMLPADTGAAPEYLGAVFPVLLAVPCGGPAFQSHRDCQRCISWNDLLNCSATRCAERRPAVSRYTG